MTSMVSEGITGDVGIVFTLDAVPFDGDVKNVRITTEDKDSSDLTFLEAANGDVKDFKVVVTAIQSTEAGSLWRTLFDDPAAAPVCVYGPHGNAVPTADKPHFNMTLKCVGKPEVGVEASPTKKRGEFEYTFDVTVGPTLDEGA